MDIQTVSITVGILTACITVIVGVVSFTKSNQRAEQQRQIDLFMQIYNRWNSMEFMKAYRFLWQQDWNISYQEWVQQGSNIDDTSPQITLLGTYYEGIGVLVQLGFIDPQLVNTLLGIHIIGYWEKIGSFILEHRKQPYVNPNIFDHTEYLYHELKKLETQAISVNL
jgi:hypothetical protein